MAARGAMGWDAMSSDALGKEIRAIIFDLDGTLYHMRWFMRPLLFAALLPRGGWLPAYMRVRKRFMGREMGRGELLLDAMGGELGAVVGVEGAVARAWIEQRFYPAFVRSLRLMRGKRPGLADELVELRRGGIRTAVLSDFARVSERLSALAISPALFDVVVSTEEHGALKPHVRPFCALAEQWQLHPSQVLVVGDRDDTDGEAARLAGMHFLQITDRSRAPSGQYRWLAILQALDTLHALPPPVSPAPNCG
jgi:FMN phosphatase YigB (HAD superfamily)